MLRKFVNDEGGYLEWVSTNPNGFVVNVDEPQSWPNYPIVHLTTDKHIHSAARTNYTTGRYFKVCSTDLDELRRWSIDTYKKELTWCRRCRAIFESSGREAVFMLPEEVDEHEEWLEGAVTRISVNAYERSPEARRKCIAAHGAVCAVCSLDFERAYGPVARGFIHVHHKVPLSGAKARRAVDPVADLVPICPKLPCGHTYRWHLSHN